MRVCDVDSGVNVDNGEVVRLFEDIWCDEGETPVFTLVGQWWDTRFFDSHGSTERYFIFAPLPYLWLETSTPSVCGVSCVVYLYI